jgi:hypothetical protein
MNLLHRPVYAVLRVEDDLEPIQCFDCAYWAGGQTDVPDYRCLHPTRKGLEVDRGGGCQEYREAPKSV